MRDFNEILLQLHDQYDWFTLQTPKGSITNTELYFIYRYLDKYKPKVVFESGVGSGRSTAILSECMRDIGVVVAAQFQYPDDNWVFRPDPELHPNLIIYKGRGEDVVNHLLSDQTIIAVIDGPKPDGEKFGRPGWRKLINELDKFSLLLGIFQHDVKDKQRNLTKTGFNIEYITKDFLSKYPYYGAVEAWKLTTPNLALLTRPFT